MTKRGFQLLTLPSAPPQSVPTWMPELVFVAIQLLCGARHIENLEQLHLGTHPHDKELVPWQGDCDAKRLLEWGIAHGRQRHDLVVLTRGVQVVHGLAEYRRGAARGRISWTL